MEIDLLLLVTIEPIDGSVPATGVVDFLIILSSRPPALLGRCPLQGFLHRLLESVRLVRGEVVVAMAYLVEGALDHELVVAV